MEFEKEKIIAKNFVVNANDSELDFLLLTLKAKKYTHSDRWSIIYDFLEEYYPNANSLVVTGLAYLVEEENL